MKNTLLTAGGAILTIQGIELAKINEAFSLLSTLLVTVIALIRLFKKPKNNDTWKDTPLYPKDENNNPEIM